ncbi:MAG: LamG domain-containing protein [Akkermansiaceae bacterium]
MKKTTNTLLALAATAGMSHAATVLEVNFSNLTQGVNVTDGDRIQDTSGNGYHGFFGQTAGAGSAVVATPTGTGINNAAGTGDGYVFIRDGLNGIPGAWDGPTTTVSPYFELDGSATGSFTLEAVLNWNNTSQTRNGIMGQTGGDQIWIREDGGNLQYAIGAGDAVSAFGSTIDISSAKGDGNYHSIALVYDGPNGEVRTYVDGALVHTNTDADIGTLPATMLDPLSDFRLGSYNGAENQEFTGIMDQFRVSDTALTPAEFLTTVPEPSSTALLGLGGLALILRRRK